MATTLPNTFSDGPGNVASGVAVTANDAKLRDAIINQAGRWQQVVHAMGVMSQSQPAGTYILPVGNSTSAPQPAGTIGVAIAGYVFYIDPADWTVAEYTSRVRVRAWLAINAVLSFALQTVGLYPVATWGGASGQSPFPATLGTVVTGSTVALSGSTPSVRQVGVSTDINVPAAGFYVLGVNTGGTSLNSSIAFSADLQLRQV